MSRDQAYKLMKDVLAGVLPSLEAMARTAKNPAGRKQLLAQIEQVRKALRAAEASGEPVTSPPSEAGQVERATSAGSEAA
jgi:hypothetical protein